MRAGWVGQLSVLTAAAAVLFFSFPERRALVGAAWLLVALAYGSAALVTMAGALTSPSGVTDALHVARPKPARPDDLERLEITFGWRAYSPRDFDHNVRPRLRELADDRLRRRDPELVPAAGDPLTDELRALLGPTPADELYGRVLTTADIERMIRDIEAL